MRRLSLWRLQGETVTEKKSGRMLQPHYIQCTSALAGSSRVTPVSKVNQTGTIRLIKHASPWRAFSSGSQICFPRAAADVMATDKREWVTPVWASASLRPMNGRKQLSDPSAHASRVRKLCHYAHTTLLFLTWPLVCQIHDFILRKELFWTDLTLFMYICSLSSSHGLFPHNRCTI